jgi:hypothetical protein
MVHAGISQLCKGFQKHRCTELPLGPSRNLLLFYAVECGLKAAWMNRRSLLKTDQIDSSLLKSYGHDLMFWAKELRLPAAVTQGGDQFRLRRNNKERYSLVVAHQAWRYGVEIEPTDEQAVAAWLESVWQWARGELGL